MSVFADTIPLVSYTAHDALDDGTYTQLLHFPVKEQHLAAHFVLSSTPVQEVFEDCGWGNSHPDGRTWEQVRGPRVRDLWMMVQAKISRLQRAPGGCVYDEKYPITVELPSGKKSKGYYLCLMQSARKGGQPEIFFLLLSGRDD